MGNYQDEDDPIPPTPEGTGVYGRIQQVLAVIVRLVGLTLLVAGLWAGIMVILEAWALYQEPARIERFADAIDSGSNLDQILDVATSEPATGDSDAGDSETGGSGAEGEEVSATEASDNLRLSYFVAWVVVLAMLLVIGILAMSAVTTGGQLALYDNQIRRLARTVVREVKRERKKAR